MIGNCFAASHLGFQCLLRPVCPDTWDRVVVLFVTGLSRSDLKTINLS